MEIPRKRKEKIAYWSNVQKKYYTTLEFFKYFYFSK